MRTREEIDAARADLRSKRERVLADIYAIDDDLGLEIRNGRQVPKASLSPGAHERLDNLRRGLARLDEQDAALAQEAKPLQYAYIARQAQNPDMTEYAYQGPTKMTEYDSDPTGSRRAGFEFPESPDERTAHLAAFKTIERHKELSARSADRLNDLVRRKDATYEAAYIAAVGAPGYLTAWQKAVLDPITGHMRFTTQERAAWDHVNEVRAAPLAIRVPATGGYLLPFELDPTITDVAAGVACPLRKLARVITMTQNERGFVTANGVVAQYQQEATAVPEAGPTIAQPKLTCARGSAFITASIETIMDVEGLVSELAVMMAAGRDRLDATKFLTGSGTDEPLGIMVPGTTGSLTTTQRIQTAVADTYTAVDAYALSNAIDPQARAGLAWVMHPTTYSYTYRMTPAGSETEPQLIPTFGGPFLGAPVYNWSTMSTAQTVCVTAERIIIGGAFSAGVTIGDRLGGAVEVIPNILSAGGLPTGQRGLVYYWRSGCVVNNPNALRYLEIA